MALSCQVDEMIKAIGQMGEADLHAVAVLALERLHAMEREHREQGRTVSRQQTQVRLGVWQTTLIVRV